MTTLAPVCGLQTAIKETQAGQVNLGNEMSVTLYIHLFLCEFSRFLLLLFWQHIYTQEDCSFIERILPDGYNIYISGKHGALVNLGGGKNKKDGTTLSQFLPMVNTLSQEPSNNHQSGEQHSLIDPEHDLQLGLQIDSMDPFGKISQIVIQSPSFNKRWAVNHHLGMFWGSDLEKGLVSHAETEDCVKSVLPLTRAQGKTFRSPVTANFTHSHGVVEHAVSQITHMKEAITPRAYWGSVISAIMLQLGFIYFLMSL